jgi:hypothetical protein
MKRTHQRELSLAAAQRAFHTVVVGVSGLYVATHSVDVTMIGTTAATVVAGWAAWLLCSRLESGTQPVGAEHEGCCHAASRRSARARPSLTRPSAPTSPASAQPSKSPRQPPADWPE